MTEEMREFIRTVIREELEIRMEYTYGDSWNLPSVAVKVLLNGEELTSDSVCLPECR